MRVPQEASHCRVTAAEIDDESIEMLVRFCERVYRVDLNDASWVQQLRQEKPFDVIVVADVLKHLYDPWSALQQAKQLVAPGGCICYLDPTCGPYRHPCVVREKLEYRDFGLLDKTHIRFLEQKYSGAL